MWCAVMRYSVHPNPRANQEHRRASVPENIRDDGADEEEDDIARRRGFAFDVDVNAAGDDKQRANERDEAEIFMPHFQHRPEAWRPKK